MQARKQLALAAEIDPRDLQVLIRLAKVTPSEEDKLHYLSLAEAIDPDHVPMLHARAARQAKTGDMAAARAILQRVVELEPTKFFNFKVGLWVS